MSTLYTGDTKDLLVYRAFIVLTEIDPSISLSSVSPHQYAPSGSVALCSSDGRFPNRFLRIIQDKDEALRKIKRPVFSRRAYAALAINSAHGQLILSGDTRFKTALMHMHAVLFPEAQTNAQGRIGSRGEWQTGYHARKKRERILSSQ